MQKYTKRNNSMGPKRPIRPRIPNNVNIPISLEESARKQSSNNNTNNNQPQPQQQEQPQPQPQQPQPVQQQQPQQPQPQPQPQPQSHQQQPPVSENVGDGFFGNLTSDEENLESYKKYEDTFFELQNSVNHSLSFDLVSYRQKGVEKRYLNVKIKGRAIDNNEGNDVECFINISSKEQFDDLKDFFSNLDWEA